MEVPYLAQGIEVRAYGNDKVLVYRSPHSGENVEEIWEIWGLPELVQQHQISAVRVSVKKLKEHQIRSSVRGSAS